MKLWSHHGISNLRKHPFNSPRSSPLGTFRAEKRRSSERNVPSGEEREETDVFAGYGISATESKVRTILQDSISHSGYKTEILIKRLKSQKLGER